MSGGFLTQNTPFINPNSNYGGDTEHLEYNTVKPDLSIGRVNCRFQYLYFIAECIGIFISVSTLLKGIVNFQLSNSISSIFLL